MRYKVVIKDIKRFNKAIEIANELRKQGFKKSAIFENLFGVYGVVVEYFKTKKDAENFISESKLEYYLQIEVIK